MSTARARKDGPLKLVVVSQAAFAGYGAIAFDEQNCAWGRSWNYPNANEAAAVALKECGHAVCKVVIEIGPRQCGSLASTQTISNFKFSSTAVSGNYLPIALTASSRTRLQTSSTLSMNGLVYWL